MSVLTSSNQVGFISDGAQLDYTIPFKWFADSELTAEKSTDNGDTYSPLVPGVDFTLDGAGEDDGGTLTLSSALTVNDLLRVTREVALTQETSFGTTRTFSPKLHENALDKLTMGAQQLQKSIDDNRTELLAAVAGLAGEDLGSAFGFLTPQVPLTPSNALQVRFRSNGYRLEVSEHGGRWRRVMDSDEVYNIFDFLSQAEKVHLEQGAAVNATAAMQAIFAAASGNEARVVMPGAAQQLFQIEDTCTYVGALGRGLSWIGQHGLTRDGSYGTGFKWIGAEGGTMFDLQGINGSRIEDLWFNGGDKAKYLLRIREQTSAPDVLVTASSGVWVRRCFFGGPTLLDGDSALVAAGRDDNVVLTLQSDSQFFEDCYFQGCGSNGIPGYGFRALEGGNCKDHTFTNCFFTELYRGVHLQSGYGYLYGCEGLDIGFDSDKNAALASSVGDSLTMIGCGIESGTMCRYAYIPGQFTTTQIIGGYCAIPTPPDNYGVVAQSKLSINGLNFTGDGRTASSIIAWTASTAMRLGQIRKNGTHAYEVVAVASDHKTAGSGGPTGTGTGIADGNVTWDYLGELAGNVISIQAQTVPSAAGGPFGKGGVEILNCPFPYTATPITAVPLFDGGNNRLNQINDFARNVGHKVFVRGCATGLYGSDINTPLADYTGDRVPCLMDTAWTDNTTDGVVVVKNVEGSFVCDVPYTLLATNQAPTLCRLPEGVLISCVAMVTQGVAGCTGPHFRVGMNHGSGLDDDSLITSQDASAIDKFGDADADLGVDLAKTVGVDPVRILCFTTNTVDYVVLTLTKTGGSFGALSAGNIRVWLVWKRLG